MSDTRGIVAILQEVRTTVFGDVNGNHEPDVYGDYDNCKRLDQQLSLVIEQLQDYTLPKTMFEMVTDFHMHYDVPIGKVPTYILDDTREALRSNLEMEELDEWKDAVFLQDVVEVADAIGDFVYVILGRAVEMGLPMDEIFAEIHRSNLSKLGEDGKPIVREDGKILKGPNYTPPDIRSILIKFGWVPPKPITMGDLE